MDPSSCLPSYTAQPTLHLWTPLRSVLAITATLACVAGGAELEPVPDAFPEMAKGFLESYCFECHGDGASEGGVDLEPLLNSPPDRAIRDRWRKVMQQLQVGVMPPPDHSPRPATMAAAQFVEQIESRFFRVDCDKVRDPGRVTLRRLNRVEYENTIRDLLGVTYHAAEVFPRDNVGYGFDNIGDVLSLSPPLLEKYLSAAETISRQVIHTGTRAELKTTRYLPTELKSTLEAGGTLEKDYFLLNREGWAYAKFSPYVPGDYVFRIRALGVQAGDELIRMAVRVAGEIVAEFELKEHRQPEDYEVRLTFDGQQRPLGEQEIHIVYVNDYNDGREGDRDLGLLKVELEGPLDVDDDAFPYPPQHRRVIRVAPDDQHSVEQAARINLKQLADRAFRRPVSRQDVDPFVSLVTAAVERGDSFERAMQVGLQAILVSPHFLFRVETPVRPDDPEHVEKVGQFELASRLSYFLWSTMPDKELLLAAKQGKLTQRGPLRSQIERMLDSPRSTALIDNFAGQWLNLRNLADVRPDKPRFPEFDEELADDMRRETQLLVEVMLRENRSLLELLTADYTFVNERLAKHYGLSGVTGPEFRRVSLADLPRRGVLTQASILTITSDPARTLPVKRGKWILETILGSAPPPPPPNVPPLTDTAEANPDATLREQLARHRQDAACAGCHQQMDPLGLAFEHYDAIGRWRETIDERPVDAAGTLPDGRQFQNAIELIGLLRERETEYAQQVTRAMLTYALGRGLEPYDQCTVDKIVTKLKRNDYRFRTLVHEIVLSAPFQMRRGDGGIP